MQSSWSHLPPTHLLSSQLMRHFCWGSTCVLFTWGNRCISCYSTLATYAACQRDISVNIQQYSTLLSKQIQCRVIILFLTNSYPAGLTGGLSLKWETENLLRCPWFLLVFQLILTILWVEIVFNSLQSFLDLHFFQDSFHVFGSSSIDTN